MNVSIPTDLRRNERRQFQGPDERVWWAWRDSDGLNYQPEPPEGEEPDAQVIIMVSCFRAGHEKWGWMVTVSGPLDAGDPIIVPPLDDVELSSPVVAFAVGWKAWCSYLDANRRCPFCGAAFDIAEKDLDGTLPAHAHAKNKAEETTEEGLCLGSGMWVEDLLRDGVYEMPSARQLLEEANA